MWSGAKISSATSSFPWLKNSAKRRRCIALSSSADMPLLLLSCAFSEVQDANLLTQDSSPWRKEYHLTPLPPWRVGVHQFHQLRRGIAVHLHPVMVGEFTEEYVPSFANVHRMLHETLRAHISFENLKLGPITAYKPVIA